MNKTCVVLTAAIVAINSASLFAGETMITRTAPEPTGCDFKVAKCETSVATDPSYMHYKDYATLPSITDVGSASTDPCYHVETTFKDYPAPQKTVEEWLAIIQEKLNKVNCPQIQFALDETTGEITVRYIKTDCGCDCAWSINIRDVKADDFVWKRSHDNYNDRLGQMERRKFHTANAQDAQDIDDAFGHIRTINGWQVNKL